MQNLHALIIKFMGKIELLFLSCLPTELLLIDI